MLGKNRITFRGIEKHKRKNIISALQKKISNISPNVTLVVVEDSMLKGSYEVYPKNRVIKEVSINGEHHSFASHYYFNYQNKHFRFNRLPKDYKPPVLEVRIGFPFPASTHVPFSVK